MTEPQTSTAMPNPEPTGTFRHSLQLAWQALLLQESAYATILRASSPFRRGVVILIIILLLVGVAQAIGLAFDLLTTPRIDLIQTAIYKTIFSTLFGHKPS